MANGKMMNKTKNAAKEGFDVVHDTVDAIGDATSSATKRVTGIAKDAMSSNKSRK